MGGYSRRELVKVAREVVSIYFVCDQIGVDYSSTLGDRAKLYCPFGSVSHIDGGDTRAFRIYEDSGTGYCFACSQFFDAVSLYAMYEDLSLEDAAETLLGLVDWRPETFEEKWDRVNTVDRFDPSYLPEALHTYCRRLDPDWVVTQMREPYKSAVAGCIRAASAVKTQAQATQWLRAAKDRMRKELT